jgi:hypothetical protein
MHGAPSMYHVLLVLTISFLKLTNHHQIIYFNFEELENNENHKLYDLHQTINVY